jgi:hypothetical protein
MTTRKLTKSERKEIEEIFKSQRSAGRCGIVRRLTGEARAFTHELDSEIKDVEKKLEALKLQRLNILKEAGLSDFEPTGRYCRNTDLHPELLAYDEETDRLLVHLLTEERIPVDVKAVLTKAFEEATA